MRNNTATFWLHAASPKVKQGEESRKNEYERLGEDFVF
jgi:hypothetical protein